MIILFVVSHAIIKDLYCTYLVFSTTTTKKLDTFLGTHNVTKTQLDSTLGLSQFFVKTKKHTVKAVLLKQLF